MDTCMLKGMMLFREMSDAEIKQALSSLQAREKHFGKDLLYFMPAIPLQNSASY